MKLFLNVCQLKNKYILNNWYTDPKIGFHCIELIDIHVQPTCKSGYSCTI